MSNNKGRLIGKEHWRTFFTGEYLGAWDIDDKLDTIVTIKEAREMEIVGRGGIKDVKPVLFFKEFEKGMVLNVEKSEIINALYSKVHISDWYGKKIALYPGKSKLSGELVPAIKVRAHKPSEAGNVMAKLAAQVRTALANYDGDDKEDIRQMLEDKRAAKELTADLLRNTLATLKKSQ